MIKGFILTTIGAGVCYFCALIGLDALKPGNRISDQEVLLLPLVFGISVAVMAIGIAFINKTIRNKPEEGKATESNPSSD